jgi:hydrogenase expression/formation protein HypE
MTNFNLICPVPIQDYPKVLLAHGGGGKLMNQLIQKMFTPNLISPDVISHDSVLLNISSNKIAFTTDSYVINPLFFPGGDIGSLSIYGTVNDLAMSGAKPLYISVGFILEEGLDMEILWEIVKSMKQAALKCGVQIVTGDTKVVDKGKGDKIFINTAGIGLIDHEKIIAPVSVEVGDYILLNGDLGRHGIAIMATREGWEFETTITSDCAPLHQEVLELLNAQIEIHCLRDLTRGGLASALNEIAQTSNLKMTIEEKIIPIQEDVMGACEILGFDPLYVANEGRFIAFIPEKDAQKALKLLQNYHPNACIIGQVTDKLLSKSMALVTLKSAIGSTRILDMLSGEQLPRIC